MSAEVVSHAPSSLAYRTAALSLGVQVVATGATAVAFFVKVDASPETREQLTVILWLDVASQAIEFVWYFVMVLLLRRIVTTLRYVDWFVSTPLMLVTTAFFFRMRAPGGQALLSVFQEDARMFVCLALNWLMLTLGLAMEARAIDRDLGLGTGGVAFLGSFAALGSFVPPGDAVSIGLFAFTFGVWALYGVAAALDDERKNVAYNGLDILAKNFYGLFLLVYALALR